RFVAPGPTVATHTPGTPVRWPTVAAMKPAEVSFVVNTNLMSLCRSASMSGSTGPLGIPNTQRTPASASRRTRSSAPCMFSPSYLRRSSHLHLRNCSMPDPETIYNWRRLDDRLTTSGQPNEAQLVDIQALGVRNVVNLGLHTHEKALPDEAASVSRLGMTYT